MSVVGSVTSAGGKAFCLMCDEQIRRSSELKRVLGRWLAAGCSLALVGTAFGAPKIRTNPAPVSNVVHPAPDFQWVGAGGKLSSTKVFRGQPVVILVATSPTAGPLVKEARRIEEKYLEFSARKTVFIAAFTQQTGRVESNVPFAIAANGADVAKAYGVLPNELSVIVISPDGNTDMVSTKVEGAQRILDVINNSFQAQAAARTGLGG